MSVKTILVPLSGSDRSCDANALKSALQMAKTLGAHVDALHVRLDPRTAAAFVGEGMTSAMIESVITLAEKDSDSRRDTAHALFTETCSSLGISVMENVPETLGKASARFVERRGSREDVLLNFGRMFDLIVLCKNATIENTGNDLVINTALLETGRPVVVVDSTLAENFGRTVAVIWNGSVESSRAITHSLPLLKDAEKVVLISAIDDLDEDINPEEATRYLAFHGIKASTCEIHGSSGRSTAESLLTQAENCQADFLVMGAFTRSRLRRLFFGAVTGEILDKCKLPVLMAH